MGKYSCFCCPEIGHDSSRKLNDKCSTCGYAYEFPLITPPKRIGKFEILAPVSRGYYGAVYRVTDELLGKDYVLKVIPQAIYKKHGKDFYAECRAHAELAKKSQYIVDISAAEEHEVLFTNGLSINCFVAVLEYVPGKVLKDLLESEELVPATKIAQVSMDLLRILDVLRLKQKNHNDLHAENIIIEELPLELRRAGEIEDTIRVVAIDIGSLTTENKSGDSPDRKSDVHWVAKYLIRLSEKLLKNPDQVSDTDFRLASLLEDRAKLLFPALEYLRSPNFNEVIENIRNCFKMQAFPWEEPLKLLNFNDTYNAQTLDPWFIPSLLVDPEDQWIKRVSGRGPLVITGMRGCGKTMMLRAMQFHARASYVKQTYKSDKIQQIEKLKEEGYIGIYVSCNKLLDEMGKSADLPLHHPYSRLFVRYGIEALKALRHLTSISPSEVNNNYFKHILAVYKSHITNPEILADVYSEMQLEQRLLNIIYSLNKGETNYIVTANPSNAFPALAQAIRSAAKVWNNHYVLFLLDDVSTRYLGADNIRDIISSLIFQSEECAFKLTSEVQTVELVLYSPGKVERAKKGRDFETFDLGSAVNDKIRNRGGKKFVADILLRRAVGSVKHPSNTPAELLGDNSLDSIAKSIVTRGDKKAKKKIYTGLSALAGVCIGDIGDMVNLYDLIIRKYDYTKRVVPIPSELQNECFQDLCSIRLHEINRRGSNYKDFALSFAEASFELLMKSAKDGDERLRQYYSIYIRITTGNTESQYEKIRELLDAGIFVYSGGANTPRTLGNDTNPISQFKLTYRKLYGLSKLIGLTNGDRFELSGEQTEEWLNNPKNGKEILMKNVGGAGSNVDSGDELSTTPTPKNELYSTTTIVQPQLPFADRMSEDLTKYISDAEQIARNKEPHVTAVSLQHLKTVSFDYAIFALGFEERSLESFTDLLQLNIKHFIAIQYTQEGNSKQMLEKLKAVNAAYTIIPYEEAITSFHIFSGTILCDISGMSKSIIFNVIRNSLKQNKKSFIAHVTPSKSYPLNEELKAILETCKDEEHYGILNKITETVGKGEIWQKDQDTFELYNLLLSDSDESKRNIVVGMATSKYERLFKILEAKQFDKIEIICPSIVDEKTRVASLASETIAKAYPNTEIKTIEYSELKATLQHLTLLYQRYYVDQNFNFEIALTGSKLQTVACAAISSIFKISHCWYVKPVIWDAERFSVGVGSKMYYSISIN